MKKVSLIWAMSLTLFLLSSCTHRLGTLAVASTKEMDSKAEYVLLKKEVTGKVPVNKKNPIERAITRAINQDPNAKGVFLKNCTITYRKFIIDEIIVTGDVWGLPPTNSPTNK